jgi:putative flippase GtrA
MVMTDSDKPATQKLFLRFSLVGVMGFVVDAAVLTMALSLGADIYTGRMISFSSAVTTTWYLNRIFTFTSQDPRLLREWGRFVSSNSVGGLINYATYTLLVSTSGFFASHPIAAVGVGSIAGLFWNFTASHRLVFAKTRHLKGSSEPTLKKQPGIGEPINDMSRKMGTGLVFMSCLVLAFALTSYLEVFTNGFSGSVESKHFSNSYFIWEFLRQGQFANPMFFAEQFYIAYPALSIGHWPSLYYTLVGGLFLLFPAVTGVVVWINLLVIAVAGFLLAMLLRPEVGLGWSLVGALAFILMPISLETLNFIMLDLPLTVVVLLAGWVWLQFSNQPSYAFGLLYGILAAAAVLINGTGWLLGLFPIFHILFVRRWTLLLDPRIYAGAFLCLLLVIPWNMVRVNFSASSFNYSFGVNYGIEALIQNLLILYQNVGPFGLVLALFALMRCWSTGDEKKELAVIVPIAISMITAALLLQSFVPVDIVSHYMMPTMSFLLLLSILGIVEMKYLAYFEKHTKILRSIQSMAILLLLMPGLMNLLAATPQRDLRMAEAAEVIVDSQQNLVVVVDGSSAGEGSFITDGLVTSKARGLYVVRTSKILSESGFMGINYQLLVQSPAKVGAILRNLGAQYIVMERAEGEKQLPYSSLLDAFLMGHDSGYRKLATLEHLWRPGLTHVYVSNQKTEANHQLMQEANYTKKMHLQ